jgi:hypothetical protein
MSASTVLCPGARAGSRTPQLWSLLEAPSIRASRPSGTLRPIRACEAERYERIARARVVREVIFLLKAIKQSVSGCRSSREVVHLGPRLRWFEGEFDEKV